MGVTNRNRFCSNIYLNFNPLCYHSLWFMYPVSSHWNTYQIISTTNGNLDLKNVMRINLLFHKGFILDIFCEIQHLQIFLNISSDMYQECIR